LFENNLIINMCGRYTLTKPARQIAETFSISIPDADLPPQYNAAPGQSLPVITGKDAPQLQLLQWGFPVQWSGKSQLVINARADSLETKPLFKNKLHASRCLVPADGFYEWQRQGRSKQPFRFIMKDEDIFAFAGLFGSFQTNDGQSIQAFTIITTSANELVKDIHDRMPAILPPAVALQWLCKDESATQEDFFTPMDPGSMRHYKVSPKVNQVANNTAALIRPWDDPTLTLF
jgi:putative SOS response-associated peptidase YedK